RLGRAALHPAGGRARARPADGRRQPRFRRSDRARFRRRLLPSDAQKRRRDDHGRFLFQPDPRSRCRARAQARRRLAGRSGQGVRGMSIVLPAPRVRLSQDDLLMRVGVVALVVVLLVMVGLPLWTLLAKGFEDRDGHFVGLANYAAYFSTPALFNSALNSFHVAAVCTVIVVPLAFLYAYALTRAVLPLRWLFQGTALIPIFAPSLLPGRALLYLFATHGSFTAW